MQTLECEAQKLVQASSHPSQTKTTINDPKRGYKKRITPKP